MSSVQVANNFRLRRTFGRIKKIVDIPNLIDIQQRSYDEFLQRGLGRISVVVHPQYRGRGLAKILVMELVSIAREVGLEKLEAEFMGEQTRARHVFSELGFAELLCLPDYLKDMQALPHDYVLMGRDILTDEEYAGAN